MAATHLQVFNIERLSPHAYLAKLCEQASFMEVPTKCPNALLKWFCCDVIFTDKVMGGWKYVHATWLNKDSEQHSFADTHTNHGHSYQQPVVCGPVPSVVASCTDLDEVCLFNLDNGKCEVLARGARCRKLVLIYRTGPHRTLHTCCTLIMINFMHSFKL